jgi:hypothetical protein
MIQKSIPTTASSCSGTFGYHANARTFRFPLSLSEPQPLDGRRQLFHNMTVPGASPDLDITTEIVLTWLQWSGSVFLVNTTFG